MAHLESEYQKIGYYDCGRLKSPVCKAWERYNGAVFHHLEVPVFYRLLTTCLQPIARLVQAFSGESSHFDERMGDYPLGGDVPAPGRFRVWLHGASAGEVNAIQPLVAALRGKHPSLHLTITTTSLTVSPAAISCAAAS